MAKVMDANSWACESLGAISVVLGVPMLALALPLALKGPRNLRDPFFDLVSMLLPFAIIGLGASLWAWHFGRETDRGRLTWMAGLGINGLALAALAIAA